MAVCRGSEELLAYEVGYRAQLSEKLFIDLAGYYNDYDKLRGIRLLTTTAGDSSVLRIPKHRCLSTILVAVLVALVVAPAVPVHAQSQVVREYEVKAAFLYNFTKFVEWPPEAFRDDRAPIVIAVLGPDPFGSTLDKIVAGKQVDGRPLIVKRLASSSELGTCHVLFVSPRKAAEFSRLLKSLAQRPTLTVSETDGFADIGGIIQFIKRQRKVRFRINVTAANRAGLKISSRLLNLAEVVGPLPNGAGK